MYAVEIVVPFVKVDTGLRFSQRLHHVADKDPLIGFAYCLGLTLAEDQIRHGARTGYFEHRSHGPMSPREIARELGIDSSKIDGVIEALVAEGLWGQDLAGTLFVVGFAQRTLSTDPTGAERQRRFRESNQSKVTPLRNGPSNGSRNGQRNDSSNGIEVEKLDLPSLRSGKNADARGLERVAITATTVTPPVEAFSADLEASVVALMTILRAANKTGQMSPARESNERREIARRVEQYGVDAVLYGLGEAIRREKASVPYAIACARTYKPEPAGATGGRAAFKRFEGERVDRDWDAELGLAGSRS